MKKNVLFFSSRVLCLFLSLFASCLFSQKVLYAQSTVLFSDDFSQDSINSQALGWELFGSTNFATVQYDGSTTNKILRLNAGATTPSSYATIRLQKTLGFSYGDIILSYKMRFNKLPSAINTTNAGNFNRIGFSGIASTFNSDGNSVNATTTIPVMSFQGNLRATTGLTFTPSGNQTLTNNNWYAVVLRITRTAANKVGVSGTISDVATNTVLKTIGGSITTTTPTLLMNQFAFDMTAIYQYNTLDYDDISLALPNSVPVASNVAINGTAQTLQTVTGSYTLAGTDTLGTTVQWFTSTNPNGPFTAIPGASSASYSVRKNDVGKYLAFRVYPASANGYSVGQPVTVVTSTIVAPHNGPTLIQSIRQTGAVACTSTIHINYTYKHPNNIGELNTQYTVYVSDSFHQGYYRILASGITTAALGITYTIDSTLKGKYLYIELLPKDSLGAYGQYSGWTAQTAVQSEIEIVSTNYLTNGNDSSSYGGLQPGIMQVKSVIKNNNPSHDSTGRLVAQLVDGLGAVVATATSNGASLLRNATATLTTSSLTIPSPADGYSIKVFFVDSITGNNSLGGTEKLGVLDDGDAVYQYFAGDGDSTNGSYLWIPPHTKTIKGIMICIKNNIETQIMESADVRRVAEKWGLAAISITMAGKTYQSSLLSGLSFDFTNPKNANKFDSIIQVLAIKSNHPELVNAPFIPMAHSAYMDFPFHVAMRDNTKCIAAIPIKSGVPDIYKYYLGSANGGSSYAPAPNANMNNVPILFYQGLMPETVDKLFKTTAMKPVVQPLSSAFSGIYRNDDSTGVYKAHNEYGGAIIDLSEGHFNALPRAVKIIATFIDKACAARLPNVYPTNPSIKPVLKPLSFASGWLVDPNYQNNQNATKYAPPAPYNQFTGSKKSALWYFDQEMATLCEQLAVKDYNKKVEQFTIYRPDSTVDTLKECVYCYHPKDGYKYTDSTGIMSFKPFSFTAPWPIDTAVINTKDSIYVTPKYSTNVLLPGVTSLPNSNLPFYAKTSASCYKHLGNLRFKLRFYRYNSSAGGYTQSYVSIYRLGNDSIAQSLRNVRLDRTQSTFLGFKSQSITFPSINTLDKNTKFVTLNATASSGMPVEYFVRSGPGIVVDNKLIITQIPEGAEYPIGITVGAYQVGKTGVLGIYAAPTVYRTIWLDDISPSKPLNLSGAATSSNSNTLIWNTPNDSLVNGYSLWRDGKEIAIITDTTFIDTSVSPNSTYEYYVVALNKLGNYSDTSNHVIITTLAPLPVQLKQFSAVLKEGNQVLCQWQVTNELNTAIYEIERSNNANNFEKVGFQKANHNTNAAYEWRDLLPTHSIQSVYYYRLKMLDQDGKYSYSEVRKIVLTQKETVIVIAPNPFKESISLSINSIETTKGNLSVYSLDGKLLLQKTSSINSGTNKILFPATNTLNQGIYLLKIQIGNFTKSFNIEKE